MENSNVFQMLTSAQTQPAVCKTHGDYEAMSFRVPGKEMQWAGCPKCEKLKVEAETRAMVREVQDQAKIARIEATLGRAAIPTRFRDRSFENYKAENEGQTKALNASKRYAANWDEVTQNGTCLIMAGSPGTGKTHLAIAIAREVMLRNDTAMFVSVIDMMRAVKETYGNSDKTERQVINEFAQPELLIMDEVGRQHGTDTERMIMFDVINARYLACKPTIIITNLTLPELRPALGEATEDRLREGGGRVILFDWSSYRSQV